MLCQQELSPHMYGIEECSRGVTCTYVPSACLHSSHAHACVHHIHIYIYSTMQGSMVYICNTEL